LGVENFDDVILKENGRAHLSGEIYKAWQWIEAARFANVNIDLIAGMVGETWDNWADVIRRTLELAPDSITIYQMELPFNTVYSQDILEGSQETPVADWPTKRAWVRHAFHELEAAGYHVSSAYTLVKHTNQVDFSYRDHLWQGSDLVGTGVASFGHVSGVHYQNCSEWSDYVDQLEHGQLPLWRGMRLTPHELLVREVILQLKRGWLDVHSFRRKFGADILQEWSEVWKQYGEEGLLTTSDARIELTREGLLVADALLPALFEPQYQGVRYT
jgi:oxygen-independent coproporphyrinogen-3 oxidase